MGPKTYREYRAAWALIFGEGPGTKRLDDMMSLWGDSIILISDEQMLKSMLKYEANHE